jgi:hypothetical protein
LVTVRRGSALRERRMNSYVAFSSGASNLVADDTNEDEDVFIRGRLR